MVYNDLDKEVLRVHGDLNYSVLFLGAQEGSVAALFHDGEQQVVTPVFETSEESYNALVSHYKAIK